MKALMKLMQSLVTRADPSVESAPTSRPIQGSTRYQLAPRKTIIRKVDREARLVILMYPGSPIAVRYVLCEGSMKASFGHRIDLWSCDSSGMSDVQLATQSLSLACAAIQAIRSPVEATVPAHVDEETDPAISPPSQAIQPQAQVPRPPAVAVTSKGGEIYSPSALLGKREEEQKPSLSIKGIFLSAGFRPQRMNDGSNGRPNFSVLVKNDEDDKEVRFYGADLIRALAEAEVDPGDYVELACYPGTVVEAGGEPVYMEVWTCKRIHTLYRASFDHFGGSGHD